MKSFREFVEEKISTLVFTFGRFNPPTVGHEKLLDRVAAEAKKLGPSAQYRVYPSKTVDPKKNPLPYLEKVKFMRKMFPKHARAIISDPSVVDAISVALKASEEGFTKLVMVVGSDRVSDFERMLLKYNGVAMARGTYHFRDGIEIRSAGERDPDSDGVEGMSASKMRAAASEGNLTLFAKGVPSTFGELQELFNAVRAGMGLAEKTNFRTHVAISEQASEIRDLYISEKVFREGDKVFDRVSATEWVVTGRKPNFVVCESLDKGGASRKFWLDQLIPTIVHSTGTLQESATTSWASDRFKEIGVAQFKSKGKKIQGVLFIERGGDDDKYEITKRAEVERFLNNLNALEPKYAGAFEFFRNSNDWLVIKQTAWTPHFTIT